MLTAILGKLGYENDKLKSVPISENLESYERLIIYFSDYIPKRDESLPPYTIQQVINFFKAGKPIIFILPSDDPYFTIYYRNLHKKYYFSTYIEEFFNILLHYEENTNFIYNDIYNSLGINKINKSYFILDGVSNIISVKNTSKIVAGKSTSLNVYIFPNQVSIANCIKIFDEYQQDYDIEIPEWINSFTILDEKEINLSNDKLISDVKTLNKIIEDNSKKLDEYLTIKEVIYTQDKSLEIAVDRLFKMMKLNSVHLDDNSMEDIQISREDKLICVEVKGVKTNTNKRYILQSSNWVDEHIKSGEENVYGLHIVNHFFDIIPSSRDDTLHPNLCTLLERRDITMIYTTVLIKIFEKFLPWTEEKADKLFNIFISAKGLLSYKDIIESMA